MESTDEPVKVFISYSHDNEEHLQRVRKLSDRLRLDGIDCRIDQYEIAPPEGWRQWMDHQLAWADFVLMVCTNTYHQRACGNEEPGRGLGATYEGSILLELLYAAGMRNGRTIPILFEGAKTEHVLIPLRQYTRYRLWAQYEDLYRHLTGQPRILAPKLGQVQKLHTEPLTWSTDRKTDELHKPQTRQRQRSRAPIICDEHDLKDTEASPNRVPSSGYPRLLAVNLGLIILLILLLLIWIFRFTDAFVEAVAVFTVGGLIAGITSFAKLISEDLRTWLQNRFERFVLPSPWTTRILLLVLVGGIAWGLSHGTLILQTIGDEVEGELTIQRLDAHDRPIGAPVVARALHANSEHRFLLASRIGRIGTYQVRFAQLPPATVEVWSLKRTLLVVPDGFRRPVLLLRPNPQLLTIVAKGKPLSLELRRDGMLLGSLEPYTGRAILVGSDRIPAEDLHRLREGWRDELEESGRRHLLDALLPLSTEMAGAVLSIGEKLSVKLRTAGYEYGHTYVTVGANSPKFPQEVVIHAPR